MTNRIALFDKLLYDDCVNIKNKQLLDDYILELKSRDRAEKTIYQYSADIRAFFCYIYKEQGNKYILDLKKRSFRQFFLFMKDNGTSAARINRFQSSVRNLLVFAEDDEDEYEYEKNAMKSIRGLQKEKVRDIVFLSDLQIKKLLKYLIDKEKYQMALYLSLSYDSAARRNEILQVNKKDFLTNNQTNIVIGKRGKKFNLVYFDRTKKIAEMYFKQRGEDNIESLWFTETDGERRPRSYSSLYQFTLTFRTILFNLTGEFIEITPHSFRHSALENYGDGTHCVLQDLGKDKMPLEVLKVIAHHDSIDTTQSYLKNKDNEVLFEAFGL